MKKIILLFVIVLAISGCTQMQVSETDGTSADIGNEEETSGEENEQDGTYSPESEGTDEGEQERPPGPGPVGNAQDCEKFTSPPANLDKIDYILPMGGTHGDHIAPVDHIYLLEIEGMKTEEAIVEVYAPEDGRITGIQHMGSFRGDSPEIFDNYHLTIQHDCGLKSIFIHIDELSEKVAENAPEFGESSWGNLQVSAGEVIGYYGGSLDYLVIDPSITNKLDNYSESYKNDPERVNIQDPLIYFEDEIEERLIELSVRTEEPIGGLIDYDVEGTLLGTWFKEGTNGWAGLSMERYWADHLAIVYDELDADYIVISIGTYGNMGAQFGVKGNSPDPITVTEETGMVKYEMVEYEHYDGDILWDRSYLSKNIVGRSTGRVRGVVLFEVLGDEKIKVEFFQDKTGAEVNGFTENAMVYER